MMTHSEISARFAGEVTRVVSALLEVNASSRPGGPVKEAGFLASIVADEGEYGVLRAFFARSGAESLTKKVSASTAEPSETNVIETIREICNQAAGFAEKQKMSHRLVVTSVEAADPPDSVATVIEIVMAGQEDVIQLALSGDLDFADAIDATGSDEAASRQRTLDVILDIHLPLVVRFGRTEMPLKALTALGPGSVIDLGRSPDEPVDVLISNRVVARGEVVIVSGNYGVRIRNVISAAERARSLEAELT
jgi:flagellar motor switch protein FliN